jgi:hypothetical protein
MPRFLHVKPKAKPEDIDAFKKGLFLTLKNTRFFEIFI